PRYRPPTTSSFEPTTGGTRPLGLGPCGTHPRHPTRRSTHVAMTLDLMVTRTRGGRSTMLVLRRIGRPHALDPAKRKYESRSEPLTRITLADTTAIRRRPHASGHCRGDGGEHRGVARRICSRRRNAQLQRPLALRPETVRRRRFG